MDELPETSSSGGVPDLEAVDYLRGVKSSTCLLIPTTPSPTPLDFKHPLSEEINDGNFVSLSNDTNGLQNLAGDSSSSGDSNSIVQDPVSAQLINNISMLDYQTLSKNGDLIIGQVEDCKLRGHLNAGNRKLPNFVNWNWSLIRKFLLWIVLTALIACLAAITAMVVTIPKECNPDLPWYQGKVFYEVFPASFKDSNSDGSGDLKGLIKKLDYIENLGASAIRLNYIFEADNYPENYYNTTSLLDIHRSLGILKDFQDLVTEVHKRKMFIILDIPVTSLAFPVIRNESSSKTVLFANNTLKDPTSIAIAFWAHDQNVDGFYLKDLENYIHDINFAKTLQIWKHLLGNNKIFIASYEAYEKVKDDAKNVILSRVDLLDVHLNLDEGAMGLKNHINEVINGAIWSQPYYPWIHWNIGNVNSERISSKHMNNILSITALELILPGTVSIFYGDEIGLESLPETNVEKDFHEHRYIHNLVPMSFAEKDNEDALNILPWNSKSALKPKYHLLHVIKNFINVRLNTPTIYLRAIHKEGNILKNTDIRNTEENLIVIERWYPRRNTCVFVGNFGKNNITTDLSSMFYGGTVVASTNTSLIGEVLYFDQITFSPNSAIVLKLEK